MTGIRRALVLSGLTLAVTIGAAIPASATFVDSAKTATTTVTTATVQAPTGVTVVPTCGTYTMDVTVRWTASPTSRLQKYQVAASVGTQTFSADVVNATTDSFTIPRGFVPAGTAVQVTITAVTDYGWTKASDTKTVVTPC